MMSWIEIILRRPRAANFADIVKIVTMFIETTFKDLKKNFKELEIISVFASVISVFLDILKVADFR